MRVIVFGRQFMHIEQGLVHTLLQLQGAIQSLQRTAPLISLGFLKTQNTKALLTEAHQMKQKNISFVAKLILYNVAGNVFLDKGFA